MAVGAQALFEWGPAQGGSLTAARTTVANVVVLVELAFLYNSRSLTFRRLGLFSNRWVSG
jgi:hypothetical protein